MFIRLSCPTPSPRRASTRTSPMQEGVISLLLAPIGFESNQHYELKRAEYSHKGNTKPVERDWSAEKKKNDLECAKWTGKGISFGSQACCSRARATKNNICWRIRISHEERSMRDVHRTCDGNSTLETNPKPKTCHSQNLSFVHRLFYHSTMHQT